MSIVARLIVQLYKVKQDWVSHGELVEALKLDGSGRQEVQAALKRCPEHSEH